MDGSSLPALLHYPCSELREQESQPKGHIDIWSFYTSGHLIERLCGLSAVLKSKTFFTLFQNPGTKTKWSCICLWVTLIALLSNSLAETGLRIHSSSVLKHWHLGTLTQTAVILQIWVLRHTEGKCHFHEDIKKVWSQGTLTIPHLNQKDTKQKIGTNYLLVYEISW